jgi:hypothetical protein
VLFLKINLLKTLTTISNEQENVLLQTASAAADKPKQKQETEAIVEYGVRWSVQIQTQPNWNDWKESFAPVEEYEWG